MLLFDILQVLREILHELKHVRRMLEPKFTLHIVPASVQWKVWGTNLYIGDPMASVVGGTVGVFFLTATASDSSVPTLTNASLSADNSAVLISTDPSDSSGLTFQVSVPVGTTDFNLSGGADVTSSTSPTPQHINATLAVTVTTPVPVTFTLTINQK